MSSNGMLLTFLLIVCSTFGRPSSGVITAVVSPSSEEKRMSGFQDSNRKGRNPRHSARSRSYCKTLCLGSSDLFCTSNCFWALSSLELEQTAANTKSSAEGLIPMSALDLELNGRDEPRIPGWMCAKFQHWYHSFKKCECLFILIEVSGKWNPSSQW